MITALYAIPITLIFIALSARVIVYRRTNRVSMGDQGDNSLLKRMRAQGNCAEYAPFGLLLMMLVELSTDATTALHVIGILLLAGRLSHAYGFSASPPKMQLRVAGMVLTFSAFLVAIACLALVGAMKP